MKTPLVTPKQARLPVHKHQQDILSVTTECRSCDAKREAAHPKRAIPATAFAASGAVCTPRNKCEPPSDVMLGPCGWHIRRHRSMALHWQGPTDLRARLGWPDLVAQAKDGTTQQQRFSYRTLYVRTGGVIDSENTALLSSVVSRRVSGLAA